MQASFIKNINCDGTFKNVQIKEINLRANFTFL